MPLCKWKTWVLIHWIELLHILHVHHSIPKKLCHVLIMNLHMHVCTCCGYVCHSTAHSDWLWFNKTEVVNGMFNLRCLLHLLMSPLNSSPITMQPFLLPEEQPTPVTFQYFLSQNILSYFQLISLLPVSGQLHQFIPSSLTLTSSSFDNNIH